MRTARGRWLAVRGRLRAAAGVAARLCRALPALLPLLLAACGDLPQPFRGNPGALATRLAAPPAFRVAIPPSDAALLTAAAQGTLAGALAEALSAQDWPVTAEAPEPLDWRLTVAAQQDGRIVVPVYALVDADGAPLGEARGAPVPVAAWSGAAEPLLREVAARDAAAVGGLLQRAERARRAIAFRPGPGTPVIRMADVTGAPGDGNAALTARMRQALAGAGYVLQDRAQGAGYGLSGAVAVVRTAPRTERVEIVWTVTRADGRELGRIVQLNEVPAGTLGGLWGDVATVVAEEAAGGVRQVLQNAGAGAAPATPAAATPAAAPR
jgi:hypothetical protein